jgi:hypothetical protein
MVQPVQDNQVSESFNLRRRADHPWLWLGLVAGSMTVHAVLVFAAFPFFGRLLSPAEVDSIPVEWVELPPIDRPPPENPTTQAPEAPPQAQQPPESPPQKIVGDLADPVDAVPQSSPEPTDQTIGYSSPQTLQAPIPGISEPLPPEQSVEQSAGPSGDRQDLPETSQPETSQLETSRPETSRPETSRPETSQPDEFLTIPIDRPPPDLSERMDIPPDAIDPSTLSQTDINPDAPTVTFIALLTIVPLGGETEEAPGLGEILSRNISDPATSPCISLINPEILRSLETTMTAQVTLTSTGEVEVALADPTDNPAYNELAECVVRSWEFNRITPAPVNPAPGDPNPPTHIPLQLQITITRQPLATP